MDINEFKKQAHELVDWMAGYFENIEDYPVRSKLSPGDILKKLPKSPPNEGEEFSNIMKDFNDIIIPGISHWQSPNFFAYFPANSSYPSVLAEMLTATLGVQGMIWETSPAAAELEEMVMNWLKKMTGLPAGWHGAIQDTASTSTLVALLSAREIITEFQTNEIGFLTNKYRIYCSTETHSSVEKAVKIAGFGKQSLTKIEVDDQLRLRPEKLEETIKADIMEGLIPCAVVAALGTTGTGAIDPLKPIGKLCERFKIWLHVDAAYAGSALVIEQYRDMLEGIELADSFVFNPHKWMFTNFDCSAYFVKDKKTLTRTFEIMPEYLKTKTDKSVNNYRDWGIQLGRRFRALKLWFVIREMGVTGIQKRIQNHIAWAAELADLMRMHPGFQVIEPQNFGLVCFYIKGKEEPDIEKTNQLNKNILENINNSGEIYMSHTKVMGRFIIRLVVGQTYIERKHVLNAWEIIRSEAARHF
jgi:aromatic-L-amino-acid decarboxylase